MRLLQTVPCTPKPFSLTCHQHLWPCDYFQGWRFLVRPHPSPIHAAIISGHEQTSKGGVPWHAHTLLPLMLPSSLAMSNFQGWHLPHAHTLFPAHATTSTGLEPKFPLMLTSTPAMRTTFKGGVSNHALTHSLSGRHHLWPQVNFQGWHLLPHPPFPRIFPFFSWISHTPLDDPARVCRYASSGLRPLRLSGKDRPRSLGYRSQPLLILFSPASSSSSLSIMCS